MTRIFSVNTAGVKPRSARVLLWSGTARRVVVVDPALLDSHSHNERLSAPHSEGCISDDGIVPVRRLSQSVNGTLKVECVNGDPKQPASVLPQSPNPKPVGPGEPLSVNRVTPTIGDRAEMPRPQSGDGRTKPLGSGQRPHPEEGLNAQEWLRERLRKRFTGLDWSVSPGEQATEGDQGRTDIVIENHAGNQYLIEVKRVEGRKIFWSKLQIETAQKRPGSYFMALVDPVRDGDEYEVYWLWAPLTQLLDLSRDIRWTWKEQASSSGISENWGPLEVAPARCADGYKAAVELTEEFLKDLDRGLEKLTRKIAGDS